MKTLILLTFVFFNLFANSQKKITIDLSSAINMPEEIIYLSDIAKDIQYIPLETNKMALIGEYYNITYAGDDIIASNSQEYAFYHFDKNGKYINTIGKKGQGPEEYNLGLFYFLDFKNRLFYTHDWNDTYCYSFNGKFIKKIKTKNLNMGTAEMLGNDRIVYSNDSYYVNKEDPTQLYITDFDGKILNKFKGKIEKDRKYGINLTTRDYMYVYNNDTYFKPSLENVIYKITQTKMQVVWEFKTGEKNIDVSRNEIDPKNRRQSIFVFNVKETKSHLFVLYGIKDKTYLGVYDKQNMKFANAKIKDDLSGGIDFVPSGKCEDGYLISAYFPKYFRNENNNMEGKIPARVLEYKNILAMGEEENPVLVLVTLK